MCAQPQTISLSLSLSLSLSYRYERKSSLKHTQSNSFSLSNSDSPKFRSRQISLSFVQTFIHLSDSFKQLPFFVSCNNNSLPLFHHFRTLPNTQKFLSLWRNVGREFVVQYRIQSSAFFNWASLGLLFLYFSSFQISWQ